MWTIPPQIFILGKMRRKKSKEEENAEGGRRR
jgi:hypothetical protein